MESFDPRRAVDALTGLLSGGSEEDRAYLKEAKARLEGRSPDDKKEATKLAVETAKMLLTIAIAVLVAVGAFVQFALRDSGVDWLSSSMILFGLTAISLLISMRDGLAVISAAYLRADGETHPNEGAWSTTPLRRSLNRQALFGLVALALLIAGLVSTALESRKSIALAGLTSSPLTIEGEWTELRIVTRQPNEAIHRPGTLPITLTCK